MSDCLAGVESGESPHFLTLFFPFTEEENLDKMKIVLVLFGFLMTISPSSAMFEVTKYWSNVVTVGDEAKIACRFERPFFRKTFSRL